MVGAFELRLSLFCIVGFVFVFSCFGFGCWCGWWVCLTRLLLTWWGVTCIGLGWMFGFVLRLGFDVLRFFLVCLSLDCWFMVWFCFWGCLLVCPLLEGCLFILVVCYWLLHWLVRWFEFVICCLFLWRGVWLFWLFEEFWVLNVCLMELI